MAWAMLGWRQASDYARGQTAQSHKARLTVPQLQGESHMENVTTVTAVATQEETLEAKVERLQEELARAKAKVAKGRDDGQISLGTNIEHKLNGHKLTIVIDLDKRYDKSASGKTDMVCSTHGNQLIGGVRLGINGYTK